MIPMTDYIFTRDSAGLPVELLLKKSSKFAKALMRDSIFNTRYQVVEGNNDVILIKNGFYKLETLDGSFFYGFDLNGKLLTGFVLVDSLIYYAMNESDILYNTGKGQGGKYYLLDDTSKFRGIIYALPIIVNGIKYLFDDTGRIISEVAENNFQIKNTKFKVGGNWEYDPVNNIWSYHVLQNNGIVVDYKDGIYPIETQDNRIYYYIFDKEGKMLTGLTNYKGNTYYLIESGALKGSVYIGTLTLNNKTYIFDAAGVMVTADKDIVALTKTEPGESGENRFIP